MSVLTFQTAEISNPKTDALQPLISGRNPYLLPSLVRTAKRLRMDYQTSRMRPAQLWRIWRDIQAGRSFHPATAKTETAAAQDRLIEALHFLGDELAHAIISVVLLNQNLGAMEKETGLPPRSAKVLVKIALARLPTAQTSPRPSATPEPFPRLETLKAQLSDLDSDADRLDHCVEVLSGLLGEDPQSPDRWRDIGLALSKTEAAILNLLAARPGRTVRRSEVFTALYGARAPSDPIPDERAVDSAVSRLRRKLSEAQPELQIIPQPGFGYALLVPDGFQLPEVGG